MLFDTKVYGIPCQCLVHHYSPERTMRITGSGYGDADPPEPEEFEFQLYDRKGYPAAWLESKLNPDDKERLKAEYLNGA